MTDGLPEPLDRATGLTAEHHCDSPAPTEGGLQPASIRPSCRPQRGEMFRGKTSGQGLPQSLRGGQHAGEDLGTGKLCRSHGLAELAGADGKKQPAAPQLKTTQIPCTADQALLISGLKRPFKPEQGLTTLPAGALKLRPDHRCEGMGGIHDPFESFTLPPTLLQDPRDSLNAREGTDPESSEGHPLIGDCGFPGDNADADLPAEADQGCGQARPLPRSGKQPKMPMVIPRNLHQDGAHLLRRT